VRAHSLHEEQHEDRQRYASDDPSRAARSGAAAVDIVGGYLLHRSNSGLSMRVDFLEKCGHEWPLLILATWDDRKS
jgi:hypothetical protein